MAPDPEPLPERLFLAVPLDDGTRAALAARLPRSLPGRRIPAASWHVTLRFLGDTSRFLRERLLEALHDAPLAEPFTLRFSRLGAFPRPERARALWVGVDEGTAELTALARAVAAAVHEAGLPPGDDRFTPHVTVARLGEMAPVGEAIRRAGDINVPMAVDDVVLYRSELLHGGARYHEVARIPLGRAVGPAGG